MRRRAFRRVKGRPRRARAGRRGPLGRGESWHRNGSLVQTEPVGVSHSSNGVYEQRTIRGDHNRSMSSFVQAGGEYLDAAAHPRRSAATRPSRSNGRTATITRYDFVTLRWLCPCAYCRGEAGMPGWLDSNPTLTAGPDPADRHRSWWAQYALQPTWADGHHTGFYTFARLREECPCAEDTARRGGSAARRRTRGHRRDWDQARTASDVRLAGSARRRSRVTLGAAHRDRSPHRRARALGSAVARADPVHQPRAVVARVQRAGPARGRVTSATRCSSASASWPSSPATWTSSSRSASPASSSSVAAGHSNPTPDGMTRRRSSTRSATALLPSSAQHSETFAQIRDELADRGHPHRAATRSARSASSSCASSFSTRSSRC